MQKIGIVLPSYQAETSLRAAVSSVRRQTHERWRLIVVDDGSTVPQRECIADVLDSDPRIELVRLDANRGAAAARNVAIDMIDEELVAFLDADDEWHPRKLEYQLAHMTRGDDPADMCATGYLYVRWSGASRIHQSYRFPRGGKDYRRLVYGCDLSPGTTLLAHTDLFRRFGGFDESMSRFEDWDWLLRCLLGGARLTVAPHAFATVNNTHRPGYDKVVSSAKTLQARYMPRLLRRSPIDALRFLSSLQLERAAAAWRARRLLTAMTSGAISLLAWPFRNRMFYLQAARTVLGFWRKPAVRTAAPAPVMHVITGLGVGGAEATLARLVRALNDRGIEQHVVSLQSGGRYAAPIRDLLGTRCISLDLQGLSGAPRAIWRLARHIRRTRPAVIQSWMYHADLVALLALWASGRRHDTALYWGVRCSDMDLSRYGFSLRCVIALCRLFSPLPDGIQVNSHAGLLSHLRAGFSNGQMMLVDNSVSPEALARPCTTRARVRRELGIAPDAFVAGVVARNDPMKGYDMVVEVARRLPGLTIVAAGAGTESLEDLPNLLRLGLRDDVPDLLTAFDVLVSASHFGEGLSNSVLEAMAAGKPVVATDVGDMPRLVEGGGVIVPRGDVDALVAALTRLMEEPGQGVEWGAANRERVARDFTVEAMADQFLSIYAARTG